MPCAHASALPTRNGGQTTSSMVARLESSDTHVWMTGTSSPCLSVFKPVSFDVDVFAARPVADSLYYDSLLEWTRRVQDTSAIRRPPSSFWRRLNQADGVPRAGSASWVSAIAERF